MYNNMKSNVMSTSAVKSPSFSFSPPLPSPAPASALDKDFKTSKHCAVIRSFDDYKLAKAQRLLDCGGQEYFNLYCISPQGCDASFTRPLSCGSRLCLSCRSRAAHATTAKLQYKLADVKIDKLALLTLTLHISPQYSLAERYELAYSAVRKLIRQDIFKRNVSGYVRTIEVKPARLLGGWNVHIHMIIEARHYRHDYRTDSGRRECEFYPADGGQKLSWQTLSEAWRELTTDSHRVDIIPVKSEKGGVAGAVGYLLKYMSKKEGFSAKTLAGADMILEYNRYMKGRRTIQSGGQWHGAHGQYSLRRLPVKKTGCSKCGSPLTSEFLLAKDTAEKREAQETRLYFSNLENIKAMQVSEVKKYLFNIAIKPIDRFKRIE